MSDTLIDLARKCEEATGPDHGLDIEIYRACGFKVYPVDAPTNFTLANAPFVTGSLDAAMVLCEHVLPGKWWKVCGQRGPLVKGFWGGIEHGIEPSRRCFANATTPALALCAATLRALSSKGD